MEEVEVPVWEHPVDDPGGHPEVNAVVVAVAGEAVHPEQDVGQRQLVAADAECYDTGRYCRRGYSMGSQERR